MTVSVSLRRHLRESTLRHNIARTGSDEARVAASAQGRRESPSPRTAANPESSGVAQTGPRPLTPRGFCQSPVSPPTHSLAGNPATAHCPANSWVSPVLQESPAPPAEAALLKWNSLWKAAGVGPSDQSRWASGLSFAAPRRRSPQRHRRLGDAGSVLPRPWLRNTGGCREPKPRSLRGLETKHGTKVPAQPGEEKNEGVL